jgi:hypothetical protein
MTGYVLNSNPWAGSFILEASTNGSSWEPMVAKSNNGTFLGREGLSTGGGGGNVSSGYNSQPFLNTQFSIYKPGTYNYPTSVNNLTITGNLGFGDTTACKIIISGGDVAINKKEDFSVHLVASGTTTPYWTPGTTKFNCTVTGYSQVVSDWTLTFNCTPSIFGTGCFFAVYVREGQGTGVLSRILTSTPISVNGPAVAFSLPSLARQSARQIGRSQPALSYGNYGQSVGQGDTSGLCSPYYPSNDYGELAGPVHLYLGYLYMGGLIAIHPNQTSTSTYVSSGIVPASDATYSWAIFPSNVKGYFASSGFAINKIISGDFTLVIKSDGNYPVVSMAYRSTRFDPTLACAFYNSFRSVWDCYGSPWGWNGAISGQSLFGNTDTVGVYIAETKTNNDTWWYKYNRTGNTLTVNYGTSLGSYPSNVFSHTCNAGDYVGCFIGAAGGTGTAHEIVSFVVAAYTAPSTLSALSGTGSLAVRASSACTVKVTGSGLTTQSVFRDFNVHLFVTDGTKATYVEQASYNCTVTSYNQSDGTLSFTAAPLVSGSSFTFVVFAYNSIGVLQATLAYSSTVAVAASKLYSIYEVNSGVKTGQYNTDAFSSSLVFAFPGDSISDVSRSINTSSTTKTITVYSAGTVDSTYSIYYSASYRMKPGLLGSYGTGGRIEIGGLPSTIYSSNFTIEFWFRPQLNTNPTGSNCIFITGRGKLQDSISVTCITNLRNFQFFHWAGSDGTGPGGEYVFLNTTQSSFALDTWSHFAWVRTSNNHIIYVNGINVGNFNWNIAIPPNAIFGSVRDDFDDFQGHIQDVRIYTTNKYTSTF